MSQHESDIKNLLEADGAFTSLIPATRIFTWKETGRHGISPQSTPAAYSGGFLQPCCIVKNRSENPTPPIKDEALGMTSYRAVVEIWLYDDGDSSGTTIENARARATALINEARLVSGGRARWIGHIIINERDDSLQDALMMRSDFVINAVLS